MAEPNRQPGRGLALAALAVAFALAVAAAPAAAAVHLPKGFQDTVMPFKGLSGEAGPAEPTMVRFAADGHVFVAQKTGQILVYDSLTDPTPTVFADLRTQAYDNGDRGLLAIAPDPGFPLKPYLYALYTYNHYPGDSGPAPSWEGPSPAGDPCPKPETAKADCPVLGRLVRLTAEGDHAVGSEEVVLEGWCQQFSSHSVGDLEFGPEGALYVSGGEGAGFTSTDYGQLGWPQPNQCGDYPGAIGQALSPPQAEGGAVRAQNLRNLSGKLLRIDPETGEGLPDNPYASSPNPNTRRILALGFRNPFRFALDPASDEIYVDNVGWDTWEEIDRFPLDSTVAYNSGWPCYEGPEINAEYEELDLDACQRLYETPGSTSPPFQAFKHYLPFEPNDPCPVDFGSAVTGITIDDSEALPEAYRGALFFADSVRGCIYVMRRGVDGQLDPSTLETFASGLGTYPGIDIEVGPDGDLYYVDLFSNEFGDEYAPGRIHRISYVAGNQPPIARLSADQRWSAAVPVDITFDASESSDSDGEGLSYEWDPEDDGSFEAPVSDPTKTIHFTEAQNYTVGVRVRDEAGATTVARLTVFPGDTPPQPRIDTPVETSPGSGEAALHWRVGQPISFAGGAEDAEDGAEPEVQLEWSSRLYHCPAGTGCHVHPLQNFPGVAAGTLIAPDHDYPSQIELTLTATDSRGLRATRSLQLFPKTVQLRLESSPPGLNLTAGLASGPAPFELTAIEGSSIGLSAPASQNSAGTAYGFSGWSDGGARVHTVDAEEPKTYVATYASRGPEGEPEGEGGNGGTGGGTPPGGGGNAELPPAETPPPRVAAVRAKLSTRPARRTPKRQARFAFAGTAPAAGFECRLGGAPFSPCSSPAVYRRLRPGPHAFRVRALNAAGRPGVATDFAWTVVRRPPR